MGPEDPDSDPDHSQNLITSSFYHFGHTLKILSKSVDKLLSYLVHKQTNGQTNPGKNITSLAEVIITSPLVKEKGVWELDDYLMPYSHYRWYRFSEVLE